MATADQAMTDVIEKALNARLEAMLDELFRRSLIRGGAIVRRSLLTDEPPRRK